jgi:hypothetical protein
MNGGLAQSPDCICSGPADRFAGEMKFAPVRARCRLGAIPSPADAGQLAQLVERGASARCPG